MKGQYTSDFRPTIVQCTCMLTSAGVRNQHFRYWLSGFSTPLSAGKFIGANCFEKNDAEYWACYQMSVQISTSIF